MSYGICSLTDVARVSGRVIGDVEGLLPGNSKGCLGVDSGMSHFPKSARRNP